MQVYRSRYFTDVDYIFADDEGKTISAVYVYRDGIKWSSPTHLETQELPRPGKYTESSFLEMLVHIGITKGQVLEQLGQDDEDI